MPPMPKSNNSIVLDLDETLVRTIGNANDIEYTELLEDKSYIDIRRRTYILSFKDGPNSKLHLWGIKRPHIKEFLHFCLSYFRVVAVWSAGTKQYVTQLVRKLFAGMRKPDIVFTRDDISSSDRKMKKPLSKIFDTEIAKQYGLNNRNTFILEDRIKSFLYSDPYNGILIPRYEPEPTISGLRADEQSLPQLMDWLMTDEVINSDDVRELSKIDIFGRGDNWA